MKHNMTQRYSSPRSQVKMLTLLLLTILLWGCASNPQKKEPQPPAPEEQKPIQRSGMSLTLPPSQFSDALNSAEQSLAEFDWMQASIVLQELPAEGLSSNDATYVGYLHARIAYIRGDQLQALNQLKQLDYSGMDPALRYRIRSFEHYILETQGDSLASAELADKILRGTQGGIADAWKRSIWKNLERTNKQQLLIAFSNATDPQWRGWLALALINRQTDSQMQRELAQWRIENPGHPAAYPLPGGLDYLLASSIQNGKVVLILPLSGQLAQAGKAVLEGFLAAHYADSSAGHSTDELLVIDVGKFPSASDAYAEALREGASIVVGPLSKQAVADLAARPERPIPILALNRIDDPVLLAQGSALVQLSLAPEDEAISVAEFAFGRGARRAIIIRPAGDWGRKVDTALRKRWNSLGGTIASDTTYSTYDDYSNSVTLALSLDASEQRARDLRAAIGANIEFTPRRRQDADVIFLLSRNGAEARSIKPLLAFHYAGNLPVYAISSIYNGVPDERNQDLNGIQLVETPWLLDINSGLRAALAPDAKGSKYTRLNALGADAYLVQSNFLRLQSGADAVMRGNTGLLSMDPTLSITRQLSPATFDAGVLKAQQIY